MKVSLDRRLLAAASFVRPGASVCDVGTDHALLPCYLVQRGISSDVTASDVNPNPLKCAAATLEQYGVDSVKLVLSDGLDSVLPADDVIVAGMGGELIAGIVRRCRFLDRKPHFILQPMTKDFLLRRELYAAGFEILEEKAAVAARKTYTVMLCVFTGEKREIDDLFAFFGKNSERVYIEKQLRTLHKMGRGDAKYERLAEEAAEKLAATV